MSVILVNTPCLPPKAFSGRTGTRSYLETYRSYMPPSQYHSFPMEHLGIMSVAAYGRSRGVPIHTVNGLVREHISLHETLFEIEMVTSRYGRPDLIGFSNIATLAEVLWLADQCRKKWREVRIVVGNTFATLNYAELLGRHEEIDFAIVGDGEVAFAELAKVVMDDRDPGTVHGVARRTGDGDVVLCPPELVDLDQLPWAARDELAVVRRAGFSPAVFTTRGCPYRCTFCGTGAVGALLGNRSYRARPLNDVVDEIEWLYRDHGVDFLVISDDLFVTKHPAARQRAAEFAALVSARDLGIRFMLDMRVDAVDRAVFAALRKAGLQRVFVGLETGATDQLAAYGKRYARHSDVPAQLRVLEDLGIDVVPGVMTFHPLVTPAEVRQTVALLRQLKYQSPHTLYDRVTPYPGTSLYRDYLDRGLLTSEWPLGEWEFPEDSGAGRVYQRILHFVSSNEKVGFAEAADVLEEYVAEWEHDLVQERGSRQGERT